MKNKVLKIICETENYISGQEISEKLGISRQAVWKHINSIKKDGYRIESVSGKGYKILEKPDLCDEISVSKYLKTEKIGREYIHFDELDSTNSEIKKIAGNYSEEGLVVLTEKQMNGRGRLGKTWFSQNDKGIWMSIMVRPKLSIYEVSKITQVVAASIHEAFSEFGIDSEIKWPNDIIINDKKICGILVEMNSEENHINYVVIGIGININQKKEDFPKDIKNIASSLKIQNGKTYNRAKIVADILNNFENLYNKFTSGDFKTTRDICRNNSYVVGKEIHVIINGKRKLAIAKDITDEGELLVEYKNKDIEKLIYGEVSVRVK